MVKTDKISALPPAHVIVKKVKKEEENS